CPGAQPRGAGNVPRCERQGVAPAGRAPRPPAASVRAALRRCHVGPRWCCAGRTRCGRGPSWVPGARRGHHRCGRLLQRCPHPRDVTGMDTERNRLLCECGRGTLHDRRGAARVPAIGSSRAAVAAIRSLGAEMTYARAPQPVTFPDALRPDTRLLIRGGRVVDPAHAIDAVRDLAVADGRILEVAGAIHPERGDRIIDAEGLLVLPGLIDLHCHFHDLFDISTIPATEVVAHGTTVALTPGAGNTLMAPALLGAEVDRGLPLHVGCYIGAAAVLATRATPEQLIAYFRGDLADSTQLQVISRNPITNATGSLAVGLRNGILIDAGAQAIARDAIAGGRCRLLTSDGPCNATMKGFGDARENIPCLLELAEEGVVSLGDSVAMMTCNPARFAAEATGQKWWTQELGHLGAGARANVVLVEPHARRAVMTLVEGRIAAFEGRCIRAAHGAGGWASRSGLRPRVGVGDLPLYKTEDLRHRE